MRTPLPTIVILRLLWTAAVALLALFALDADARADTRPRREPDPWQEPPRLDEPDPGSDRDPSRDAAPEDPAPPKKPRRIIDDEEERITPPDRLRLEAEALWIPALKLWKMREDMGDVDEDGYPIEDPDRLHARIHMGEGGGLRLALMSEKGNGRARIGGGLLYLGTTHSERVRDSRLDVHALVVEGYAEGSVPLGGLDDFVDFTIGLGLGVGGYVYDFGPGGYEDEGGFAFEARLVIGLQVAGHFHVRASGGALVLTDLFETRGLGFFGAIEAGVSF